MSVMVADEHAVDGVDLDELKHVSPLAHAHVIPRGSYGLRSEPASY